MKLRPLALALALLVVAPVAAAQIREVAVPAPSKPGIDFEQPIIVELRLDTPVKDEIAFQGGWLLVGRDNVMNLTIRNYRATPLNATFAINVTGATASPTIITLQAAPGEYVGATFTVRPDDVGTIEMSALSEDAFEAGGAPLQAKFSGVAAVIPSVRVLDPPRANDAGDDEEFALFNGFGGSASAFVSYARVRSGDGVTPRVEVRNDLETTTPAMRLTGDANGRTLGPVDVPALEPGESRTIDLPEYVPLERQPGFGFGGVSRFEVRLRGTVTVGGLEPTVDLVGYRVVDGVVRDVIPAVIIIDVQDGIAIDLYVPKNPVLGVPTRIKFNVTNNGATRSTGDMVVQLQTPGLLYYEVQGPESHVVHVDLAPGETVTGAIAFTPRVTGYWGVSSFFRGSDGMGYGGGGASLEIKGPVAISTDTVGTIYARIGEAVRIDISVATSEALQGAELRLTSGTQNYFDPLRSGGSGEFRPGMAQRMITTTTTGGVLDTFQPGGVVNASVEVVGRSAGRYTLVAYVLSDGFAYTSSQSNSGIAGSDRPMVPGFFDPGSYQIAIAVQPRPLDAAWAIAPLFGALAFFVGMWTLRTRFVK